MSAVIASQPRLVQHTFDWDEPHTAFQTLKPTSGPSKVAAPSARVTVPTVRETSCVRRGRCEHVGGVMANVLSKYGLGVDDLLHAIEELKAKRSAAAKR